MVELRWFDDAALPVESVEEVPPLRLLTSDAQSSLASAVGE
jgi:hypothetical protein